MKLERQRAILDLVRTSEIYTQEELTAALAKAGFPATQATISRDIRELRLTKEPTRSGQRYVVPSGERADRPTRILRDGLVSADYAGNMLVVRTHVGMAMAVATALDEMKLMEIVGTVAGDDVVMCVIRSEAQAAALVERLVP